MEAKAGLAPGVPDRGFITSPVFPAPSLKISPSSPTAVATLLCGGPAWTPRGAQRAVGSSASEPACPAAGILGREGALPEEQGLPHSATRGGLPLPRKRWRDPEAEGRVCWLNWGAEAKVRGKGGRTC